MKPYTLLAVIQPGLEEIAREEIIALGYQDLGMVRGGIFLKGHLSTVIRLNLFCRTLSRVLIEIDQFEAKSFSQLEKQFSHTDWKSYVGDRKVCIRASCFRSALYHEKAVSERLIASLAKALGKPIDVVGSPDEDNTQLIVIHAVQDVFTIRMDSSGAHLHKRGYGICKEDAPLRETVAAALLYRIGWPTSVNYLFDPMCGSGTIPIEAALMAQNKTLHAMRDFSFKHWQTFQPEVFAKIAEESDAHSLSTMQVHIVGSDYDAKAIRSAKANAETAGVSGSISFGVSALSEINIDKKFMVLTNPPWGKRINDGSVRRIWQVLSDQAVKGSSVHLLLPEIQESEFPYPFSTLLSFSSGDIRVKLIKLEVRL